MEEKTARLIAIDESKMFAQPQYSITYCLSVNPNDDAESENTEKTIILPPGIPSRGNVVNAIVVEEYPSDRMQAVQNNYLLDPTDEDAKAEMDLMQQCRKDAKIIADEVLERINEERE